MAERRIDARAASVSEATTPSLEFSFPMPAFRGAVPSAFGALRGAVSSSTGYVVLRNLGDVSQARNSFESVDHSPARPCPPW